MFRVCQVVGRGASRSRWLVGLLTPGAAVTPNTAPALRRGFAGGLSEHGTSMKWQSVAVGAAAIAVAYEGARLWEPKTAHAEAPKQRNTATPPVTTSPPPPATPTTEPKNDEKPPSTETKPPEKKTQVPAVAKSEPELFFAQLLSQRRVFLNGRVDDKSAHALIGKLLFLDQVDPTTPIVLYINSGGGVVTAGLAIYDVMMHVCPPVYTVCIGHAESMAAVLLSAGAPGFRYVLPNARVMIHQPHHVISGQTSDILIKSKKAERTRKSLADILVKHTGRSDKEVGDALERDTYMSASEAVGFGIVDREIVSVGEIGGK